MSTQTLEDRVAELESQVSDIQEALRLNRNGADKDWRRTIGAFTDNEGVKSVLQDAMRLREEDRVKARSKAAGKAKRKR